MRTLVLSFELADYTLKPQTFNFSKSITRMTFLVSNLYLK
jgi:hypothetical protein